MSMQQIIDAVRSLDGALIVEPREGDGTPPLAWGDAFFYYAPDGRMPANTQPYGTIVTKDYPDDALSRLGDGTSAHPRWRVNVHVGRTAVREWTREATPQTDFAAADVFLPHPVYGELGWIAVVEPGSRTIATVIELLRAAHGAEKARTERRSRA